MYKTTVGIAPRWMQAIESGKKIVEGRLNNEGWHFPRNHILKMKCSGCKGMIKVRVLSTKVYNSFRQMLKEEGLENVLPGVSTIDEGVRVYREFYSKEREKKRGVIAIRIEFISKIRND